MATCSWAVVVVGSLPHLFVLRDVDEVVFVIDDCARHDTVVELPEIPEMDHWEAGDWDPGALFRESVRSATANEKPETTTPSPDLSDLSRGDLYPGSREGYHFSVDSDGEPFEKTADGRRHIDHAGAREIAEYVHELKGGGKVVVNDHGHALTTTEEGFIYIGAIDPREFDCQDQGQSVVDKPDDDELDSIF